MCVSACVNATINQDQMKQEKHLELARNQPRN